MVLEFANSPFVDKSYHLRSSVKALLPHCSGLVLKLKNEGASGFSCLLRTTIDNKNDAIQWMKDFQELTNTEYRVNNTFAENTSRIIFKKKYYCDRNIRRTIAPGTRHRKLLTGCKSRVNITVKQPDMKRSKDKHLKEYPCEIFVHFMHNHAILKNERTVKHKCSNSSPPSVDNDERILADSSAINSSNFYGTDILDNCEIYYICEDESRSPQEESRNAVCEDLKDMFKTLKDKIMNESETYLEPVKRFIDSFNALSARDDNLVAALHYFCDFSNSTSTDDASEDLNPWPKRDSHGNPNEDSSHYIDEEVDDSSCQFGEYDEIVYTTTPDEDT